MFVDVFFVPKIFLPWVGVVDLGPGERPELVAHSMTPPPLNY